jgi:hypothetical protein
MSSNARGSRVFDLLGDLVGEMSRNFSSFPFFSAGSGEGDLVGDDENQDLRENDPNVPEDERAFGIAALSIRSTAIATSGLNAPSFVISSGDRSNVAPFPFGLPLARRTETLLRMSFPDACSSSGGRLVDSEETERTFSENVRLIGASSCSANLGRAVYEAARSK